MNNSNTLIAIDVAGHRLLAQAHAQAPQTVAAFLKLLPYRQKFIHVRWSGEGVWVPLGEWSLGVGLWALQLFQQDGTAGRQPLLDCGRRPRAVA